MKKRVYAKPILESETFVPQNYIAACGDTNYEYLFKCDAMGGIVGAVFLSDGDDKFEPNVTEWGSGDKLLGLGYHACGDTHKTEVGDEFIEGWYVTGWDGLGGGDWVKRVMIWKGPDGNNIHCTQNLDKNSWDTAKS